MLKWISNLLDSNEKEIHKLQPMVDEINDMEQEMKVLSDEELKGLTEEFRERLQQEDDLEDLLPEAFAAVREAASRSIGQRHYDAQLMGGMVLHQGKISEMKTGEGKTLVATLPAYLNALSGRGVHVVTVNDYLAKRDTQWMGAIYHFLGLTVACIQHESAFIYDPTYTAEDPSYNHLRPVYRAQAYRADITHGTNNEFGFDYLRDNMVVDRSYCVQRELNYAIVDEVDNILIDEARTPLIISGAAQESTQQYYTFARLVPRLQEDEDYVVDAKSKSVSLTESGISKLEKWLNIPNLYDPAHVGATHFAENALKAEVLFKRDRDYIVKDGEVLIVDEFTGRQMPGRRWSDGLHQAIEAKEGLKIQRESLTMATITLQNYFRLYSKLSGMTGTAVTEAEEFHKIYKLDVVVIPTNKPMVRHDLGDQVYKTEAAKFQAAVAEIEDMHSNGRPVLVGTVSIERSEVLGEMLKRKGVPHQVLNAKFHEREAQIVTQAGRLGSVTIATNMAGRGTDIILGGNPEGLAMDEAQRLGIDPNNNADEFQKLQQKMKDQCASEHEQVVAAGGLHIIGTERHEARRIDNQLRGRSGRQGDPGSSRFYISLEDDIIRRFGGDRIKGFMDWAGLEDDVPIEHGLVSKSIETAQTKVEAYNFDLRKHLVEYDDVVNVQRDTVYTERRKILSGADLKDNVLGMVEEELANVVAGYIIGDRGDQSDVESVLAEANTIMPLAEDMTVESFSNLLKEEIQERLIEHSRQLYDVKEEDLGPEDSRVLERLVMLQTIDNLWVSHLTELEELRQGIGLRAYAQVDPLVMYKKEAFTLYEQLLDSIRHDIAHGIFHATISRDAQPTRRPAQPLRTNQSNGSGQGEPVKVANKVGRNDPCPCGSGKKYKRCHGA
ncbi:MAG: preprotein translocase subunit SecA [Dehalococcoidia bacterium]|nr:preprotein translocase subunit SecA [Dehalococcoidia bacterium]